PGGSAGAEFGYGVSLFAVLWVGVGGEQERGGCDTIFQHIFVVYSSIANFVADRGGSNEADDVFDGADGGDIAVCGAAVSGADERSAAREGTSQREDWKYDSVSGDRDGGGAGGGGDSAGDFWRKVT